MSAQLEWQECPVLSLITKSLLQEIDRERERETDRQKERLLPAFCQIRILVVNMWSAINHEPEGKIDPTAHKAKVQKVRSWITNGNL
jgi:hypothetical protein